jgi:hypothetical protein
MTTATNRMPPKSTTKRKDPPLPAEEASTDPAEEVPKPPPSDHSSLDGDNWEATVAATTFAASSLGLIQFICVVLQSGGFTKLTASQLINPKTYSDSPGTISGLFQKKF